MLSRTLICHAHPAGAAPAWSTCERFIALDGLNVTFIAERGDGHCVKYDETRGLCPLALSHLALAADATPDRLINTKEIAEEYEIPVELLAKILQILAKNGLVASHPGPTGGYRILRSAEKISVGEVVALIDGPLSLMHCSSGQESSCKQYNRCTIRSPLATIETRVKDLLANISVAEISRTLRACPAPEIEDYSRRSFAAAVPMA